MRDYYVVVPCFFPLEMINWKERASVLRADRPQAASPWRWAPQSSRNVPGPRKRVASGWQLQQDHMVQKSGFARLRGPASPAPGPAASLRAPAPAAVHQPCDEGAGPERAAGLPSVPDTRRHVPADGAPDTTGQRENRTQLSRSRPNVSVFPCF